MFQDVLHHMEDATRLASIGLVIFFVVFLMILLNALVRSKRDVTAWSQMPLVDDEMKQSPEVRP